ncbi:MAG: glycoside hydrolase family 172 protein [Steroidobacteraceae bacterium]
MAAATCLAQETVPGAFMNLMVPGNSTTARVSSFDHSGGNEDFRGIAPGKTLELADLAGSGVIRHLYFSVLGGDHYLRDLVLRAYWDGSSEPCVEVPFGDFFGLGQERPRFFSSLIVTVNPGDLGVLGTLGLNAYFPMPFAKGARLTLTNEGTDPVFAVWYHVEYEKLDHLPKGMARFHASWHRLNKTVAVGEHPDVTLHPGKNLTGDDNYVILEATGRGNIAGIFLNIDNSMGSWYGEGDDMIFIDGERWPPSYHGTGTEEIFGGGACPTTEYAGPYTGFHLISNPDFSGKVSMYRFYVNDPIRFRKSIRMTLEHGHANNIANDYSSTVFWYQTGPHRKFPPLPGAMARRPAEGEDRADRAYRELLGLRQRMLQVWLQSVGGKKPMPEPMQTSLKVGLTRTYLERDYDRLHTEIEAMKRQLEAMPAPPK